MSRLHKVFVYGTLKRNEPNHHWLTDEQNGKANLLAIAKTISKFPLVIASRYNIPYLIAAEGQGKNIEGEVYEVDDPMLAKLDILENHPTLYERKIHCVTLAESSEPVEVWIYHLYKFKPCLLNLPFLTSYESKGSHKLEFIARNLRDVPGDEYWIDVQED